MGFRYATGRLYKPKAVEAGDWWLSGGIDAANCLIAYQPKGAASYVASLNDLSWTGNNASKISLDPDWDSTNGWKFDNSKADYLTTGIHPVNNLNQTMLIRVSGTVYASSNGSMCGARTSSCYCLIGILGDGDLFSVGFSVNRSASYDTNQTSGVVGFAKYDIYFNGVDVGTVPGYAWFEIPHNMLVGGVNYYDTAVYDATFNCQAFAYYDIILTPEQVLAVSTAMNAL